MAINITQKDGAAEMAERCISSPLNNLTLRVIKNSMFTREANNWTNG